MSRKRIRVSGTIGSLELRNAHRPALVGLACVFAMPGRMEYPCRDNPSKVLFRFEGNLNLLKEWSTSARKLLNQLHSEGARPPKSFAGSIRLLKRVLRTEKLSREESQIVRFFLFSLEEKNLQVQESHRETQALRRQPLRRKAA